MKKQLLIICLGLIITLSLKAQTNTFPTSGNVGIGTTNPLYELGIHDNGTGTDTRIHLTNGDTGTSWSNGFQLIMNGALSNYKVNLLNRENSDMGFWTNNTERVTINNTGNVGIGTTSPDQKLHINNGRIKIESENPELQFFDNSGSTYFSDLQYIDNKFHYRWGQGIKHTFETNAFVIGDYLGGENEVKISRSGNSWFNGGNVGIGTTTPSGKLDIHGDNSNTTNLVLSANYIDKHRWRFKTIDRGYAIDMDITASSGSDTEEAVLKLSRSNSTRPEFQLYNNAIVVNDGYVGIGTTDTKGFKLGVQGKIAAEEVKVATYTNWADFVFKNNYNLPTLKEVEQHIKDKGHLKDIPSAEEIKKEGFFLGEMDSKLLQKIEELTLYTIEQQKEIEAQNNKIEQLENKNNELKSLSERLTEIEKLLSNIKHKQ